MRITGAFFPLFLLAAVPALAIPVPEHAGHLFVPESLGSYHSLPHADRTVGTRIASLFRTKAAQRAIDARDLQVLIHALDGATQDTRWITVWKVANKSSRAFSKSQFGRDILKEVMKVPHDYGGPPPKAVTDLLAKLKMELEAGTDQSLLGAMNKAVLREKDWKDWVQRAYGPMPAGGANHV